MYILPERIDQYFLKEVNFKRIFDECNYEKNVKFQILNKTFCFDTIKFLIQILSRIVP